MGKIVAFFGILVVGGVLVVWKLVGKTEDDGVMGVTNDKKVSGTDVRASEKKVSIKTSYENPAGSDEVGFSLTVNSEGVIVATETEVLAIHDISKKRQDAFASDLTAALQGKKLSDLSPIDRVGGSSLTTGAFNQAIPQLKAQL